MHADDLLTEAGGDDTTLAYINVNSILAQNKIDEIKQLITKYNISCLGIGESKLDRTISNDTINLHNFYTPICLDKTRNSGGVLAYVRKNVLFDHLRNLENGNECVWLKIENRDSKFIIAYYYGNPGQSLYEFEEFLQGFNSSIIEAKSYKLPIHIMGDFNVHHKKWDATFTNRDQKGDQVYSLLEAFCFKQLINQKTYFSSTYSSLIDLFFSDCVNSIKFTQVGNQICEKHCPIICSLTSSTDDMKKYFKRTIYNYKNCQSDDLCNFIRNRLSAINMYDMSVDDCTNFITHTLLTARDKFVPSKIVTVSKKDEPWITEQIKTKIKHRNKLFKVHRRRETLLSWQQYKAARNEVTKLKKEAKTNYYVKTADELSNPNCTSKKWHKIVNNFLKKSKHSFVPPLKYKKFSLILGQRKS